MACQSGSNGAFTIRSLARPAQLAARGLASPAGSLADPRVVLRLKLYRGLVDPNRRAATSPSNCSNFRQRSLAAAKARDNLPRALRSAQNACCRAKAGARRILLLITAV